MIRFAFFDVGETLIHGSQPLPGVAATLGAIAGFRLADGSALTLGVISNYFAVEPPRSEARIAAMEAKYRAEVLDPAGLSAVFTPFAARVTISSRPGVAKPERGIFDAALARIGGTSLSEGLFVTEDLPHLQAARSFGLVPVRFGPPVSGMASFDDWSDAPAVVAGLVTPGGSDNHSAAAAVALDQRFGLVGFQPREPGARTCSGPARQLVPLHDERLGPLNGVYVELPTEVTVEFGADGRVWHAAAAPLEDDAVDDATSYVRSLVASRNIQARGAEGPTTATHAVETDAAGRPRLVRRGYSAR